MALNVEILSRETIKPSPPTPQNLSTYNLSLLDQLASKSYVPFILFYSANTTFDVTKSSNLLKQSLSQTLAHMYPLAGRIKDAYSIECNDQGVEYVEARVNNDMSNVLNHPKIDQLKQLLPCDPNSMSSFSAPIVEQVLLLVQTNRFNCGGTAVAVCIHHTIADFSTAGTFLRTWATIARGENVVDNFIVDCTSLFPPKDVSPLVLDLLHRKDAAARTKVSRFIFSGSNIRALKQKATETGYYSEPPSRVVAVSSFIWKSMIASNREGSRKNWNISTMVNLRPRMDEPITPHCLGNLVQGTAGRFVVSEGQSINYGELAKIVMDSIQQVNSEYVKTMFSDEDYIKKFESGVTEFAKYYGHVGWLNTTSWCRSGVYEVDFGWGKPIWLGTTAIDNNFAFLMDTCDGEGIEAWANLEEEDMEKLVQNAEFLSYVSLCQTLT